MGPLHELLQTLDRIMPGLTAAAPHSGAARRAIVKASRVALAAAARQIFKANRGIPLLDEEVEVLRHVRSSGPMTSKGLAQATDRNEARMRDLIGKMKQRGLLAQTDDGLTVGPNAPADLGPDAPSS